MRLASTNSRRPSFRSLPQVNPLEGRCLLSGVTAAAGITHHAVVQPLVSHPVPLNHSGLVTAGVRAPGSHSAASVRQASAPHGNASTQRSSHGTVSLLDDDCKAEQDAYDKAKKASADAHAKADASTKDATDKERALDKANDHLKNAQKNRDLAKKAHDANPNSKTLTEKWLDSEQALTDAKKAAKDADDAAAAALKQARADRQAVAAADKIADAAKQALDACKAKHKK